jgi:hypothetical protein
MASTVPFAWIATPRLGIALTLSVFNAASAGDDGVTVAKQKQLFFDDAVVASSKNVQRLLGKVEKDSRQVLDEEGVRSLGYGTVLYRDDRH